LVKFAAVSLPGIPAASYITRNEEQSSAVLLGALTGVVVDSSGYATWLVTSLGRVVNADAPLDGSKSRRAASPMPPIN
jgi:hypothetical protein